MEFVVVERDERWMRWLARPTTSWVPFAHDPRAIVKAVEIRQEGSAVLYRAEGMSIAWPFLIALIPFGGLASSTTLLAATAVGVGLGTFFVAMVRSRIRFHMERPRN